MKAQLKIKDKPKKQTEQEKSKKTIAKKRTMQNWWSDLYTDGCGNCYSDADSSL